MTPGDLLFSMFLKATFSFPLLLVWSVAVGLGVRLLPRNRPAAMALMAAGSLEVFRLIALIFIVPIPSLLYGAGIFGDLGLTLFALLRGLASLLGIVVSHSLLLLAIFGWRGDP